MKQTSLNRLYILSHNKALNRDDQNLVESAANELLILRAEVKRQKNSIALLQDQLNAGMQAVSDFAAGDRNVN